MDQQLVESIRQRIAVLAAEREQHARGAQRVDYGYAAAIGELQRLLASLEAPAEAPPLPQIDLSTLEEELTDPEDEEALADLDDEEEGETNATAP